MRVGILSPCRWVMIRILPGDRVCMGLRWDNRLSVFYWAIILKVGRNSGVHIYTRSVMSIGRKALRGILRIHGWPCQWLLGNRDTWECRRIAGDHSCVQLCKQRIAGKGRYTCLDDGVPEYDRGLNFVLEFEHSVQPDGSRQLDYCGLRCWRSHERIVSFAEDADSNSCQGCYVVIAYRRGAGTIRASL
jgi:hypothetical protein